MIAAIIIIGLALYWLAIETDYLRVRLLVGKPAPPKYARYKVYNSMGKGRKYYTSPIYEGDNYPPDYSPNGEPEYNIILSPGINGVLCGYDWLNKHCAALVDYAPDLYLATGGVRYTMHLKQPTILKDVMKANKLKKAERLAYA